MDYWITGLYLNFVFSASTRSGEKACMQEMMEVMSCLGKFGGDQVHIIGGHRGIILKIFVFRFVLVIGSAQMRLNNI